MPPPTTLSPSEPNTHVDRLRSLIEEGLAVAIPDRPPQSLYEPARYILEGKGKRLRPCLLMLVAEAFGRPATDALDAALAVEVFHNFTLVHDDIMDHADTRRGRTTLHVRWDEPTAILAGDYLMGLSYELLAKTNTSRLRELLAVYHAMVQLLCEGQALDKEFEARASVSVDGYLAMIDRKTGALLEASFVLGGIIGDAGREDLNILPAIGKAMGRAFQIQDDLLDLIAQDARWGKKIGGDLIEGKKAFLLLKALELAEGEDQKWFQQIINERGLSEDAVPEARARMERIGVVDAAVAEVDAYSGEALSGIKQLPQSEAREALAWLTEKMQRRHH